MDPELVTLDRRSRRPYYVQIADGLQAAMESGALQAGDRLPPVRDLAERLGVNFNTVARAYRRLADRGDLEPRPGRGTVVRAGPEGRGAARLERETAEFLQRMDRLGYSPQDVHWEFSGAIRSWMQAGAPPQAGGA